MPSMLPHSRRRLSAALVAAILLTLPWPSRAQTADNVLLVINTASETSVAIGDYYAAKRNLADTHIVRIRTSVDETVPRDVFLAAIERPIGAWLARHALADRILYIVLTKGVPLRIAGSGGRTGTSASVDSELTLLYRKIVGHEPPVGGSVPNPLFAGEGDGELTGLEPLTRADSDIYLVTRLDGFTQQDVFALIDRALAPSAEGTFLLDQKNTFVDRGGDAWLETAAERLRRSPVADRTVLEETRDLASAAGPVAGYYSWGSNDPANQLRRFGLTFSPGAIGAMFVSTDGRTFIAPPDTWKPSPPEGGPVFRGSFQSLAGDLIQDGITGVAAHVNEPFLDATIRPQILFPAYVSGRNLAESFYRAMPYLSWQTVVIGDPLCRPYGGQVLSSEQIAGGGIDAETGLPALLSARRLALLSEGGLNREAVTLLLRSDVERSAGRDAEAEALLVRATSLEPRLVRAHLELAGVYGASGDYDRAIDSYRKVLGVDADHLLALNNLAYMLAENKKAPQQALPLADRAFRLDRTSAPVIDTLAWVHHLAGDHRAAAFFIDQAISRAPGLLDARLHAAAIYAALGNQTRAASELTVAERLDASIVERDDFKALASALRQP